LAVTLARVALLMRLLHLPDPRWVSRRYMRFYRGGRQKFRHYFTDCGGHPACRVLKGRGGGKATKKCKGRRLSRLPTAAWHTMT
jgi:hypothetical protein